MRRPARLASLVAVVLTVAAALPAQVRFGVGFDAGMVMASGDLGRPDGPPGFVAAFSLRTGAPGSRATFALEAQYQRIPLDTLYIPAVSEPGVPNTGAQRFPASTWKAWGVLARIDYRIVGGFYAIGGTGVLWREQVFEPVEPPVAPFESADPIAQAGFGYRFGGHFVLEARFINIFTVNESERTIPITVGIRF